MTSPEVTNDKGLTNPNASFWDDYIAFSEKYDKDRMGTWDDRIGVLLLFATVFAAVLTPFLVPVSALLSPDPMAGTNARLDQIILLLQNSTAKQTPTDTSPFVPRASIVTVNVLWFASLGLSLFAALFSILAKQWLRAYAPSTSGTPHERARSQQELITAFDAWHIGAVIEAMPVVLHLSLALFLAGLVVYLWTLNRVVAGFATGIVGVTFLAYAVVFFLPLFSTTCPYYNPVLRQRKPPLVGASADTGLDLLDVHCMTWLLDKSTDSRLHLKAVHTLVDIPVRFLLDLSSADIKHVSSCIHEAWQQLELRLNLKVFWPDESFLSQYEILFRALVKILQGPNLTATGPLPELQLARSLGSHLVDYTWHSRCLFEDKLSANSAAIAALSLDLTLLALSEKSASEKMTALSKEYHLHEDMSAWFKRYSEVGVPSQVLLMDSLALCFMELAPAAMNEPEWFKDFLALIFPALKKSEGAIKATPEGKELRLAAANALFCALFDMSRTKYDVQLRFTPGQADHFLIPYCYHLLHPENGLRAWTVKNSDALSTIAVAFYGWKPHDTTDSFLVPCSLDKAAQWLWDALAEEDVDIRALYDTVKNNLSAFWSWASDHLREDKMISVLIEPASHNMRPLLHLIRGPLTLASLKVDVAVRSVLDVLDGIYHEYASSVARAFQEAGGVELLGSALEDAWNIRDLGRGYAIPWRFSQVVHSLAAHFTAMIPIATNHDRAFIGSQVGGMVKAFHRACRKLERTQDLGKVRVMDETLNLTTVLEWHIKASGQILPPLYTLTSQLEDCADSWKKAYRGLAILRSLTVDPYKPFEYELLGKLWNALSERFGNIQDEPSDDEDALHDPVGGPSNADAEGEPSVVQARGGDSKLKPESGPSNLQVEGGASNPDPKAGPSDGDTEGGSNGLKTGGGARESDPEGGARDGEGGPSDDEGDLRFLEGNPGNAEGGPSNAEGDPSDRDVAGAPSV